MCDTTNSSDIYICYIFAQCPLKKMIPELLYVLTYIFTLAKNNSLQVHFRLIVIEE